MHSFSQALCLNAILNFFLQPIATNRLVVFGPFGLDCPNLARNAKPEVLTMLFR